MGMGNSIDLLPSDPTQLLGLVSSTAELYSCTADCAKTVCTETYKWRPIKYAQCYSSQVDKGSDCRQKCFLPTPGQFETPGVQSWRPEGPREAYPENVVDHSIVPVADQMHTMHVDNGNSDNVLSAVAVEFELEWVAEESLFCTEGPTLDNAGNVYFTPLSPEEDVGLVALDAETGERKWSIPGKGPSWGAPLVLNDPSTCTPEDPLACEQLVYFATRDTAYALRSDGSRVWEKPTGLPFKDIEAEYEDFHQWGFNYVQTADALVGVSITGELFALSRATGDVIASTYSIACAPAAASDATGLADWVYSIGNTQTDAVFGKNPAGNSFFETLVNVVFGVSKCVSNYFGVDVNTGRIYVAATAREDAQGEVTSDGAIYLLELVECSDGEDCGGFPFQFKETASRKFVGGTGSTPTISADSSTIYVSDALSNVLALDAATLEERWTVNVGEQLAASIAVPPHNNEVFAVTRANVFKLQIAEDGNSAEIAWTADLSEAFPGQVTVNALTPLVVANGVVVSVASVMGEGTLSTLITNVGYATLDRATGKIRSFAQGREESISVSLIGNDGSLYSGNSPVRRAVTTGVFGAWVPPLVGGVSKYKSTNAPALARDATCAAAHIAENAVNYLTFDSEQNARSAQDDARQIRVLVNQAKSTQPELAQSLAPVSIALDPVLGYAPQSPAVGSDILSALETALESLNSACATLEA